MSYAQAAEVSSRPRRGHIDSVMYTNHCPWPHGARVASRIPTPRGSRLQAFVLSFLQDPAGNLGSGGTHRSPRVIRVMYTTSAVWIPWKAQDQHRSWVPGTAGSLGLLPAAPHAAHLWQYQAGPALEGTSSLESPGGSGWTQPGVTRCWPALCCLTPSCCCSPPWRGWGQEIKDEEETWSEAWSKVCL